MAKSPAKKQSTKKAPTKPANKKTSVVSRVRKGTAAWRKKISASLRKYWATIGKRRRKKTATVKSASATKMSKKSKK